MKKITLVFAFMLAVAGAAAQSMYVHKTDGNVYEFKVSDVDSINFAASTSDDYFYTVTYIPNGGEGEVMIDTVCYGAEYTVINGNLIFSNDGSYCDTWNTKSDGTGASYIPTESITIMKHITLYAQWNSCTGVENGYGYVDLGLSVKWATCNIGAFTPESFGNYYAWGEAATKNFYDWSNYRWYNPANTNYLLKYYKSGTGTDNKTALELEDDVAHINWGGLWRMPTTTEWSELQENCTWTWVTQNGINGYEVKATNGNSIFLPTAGFYEIYIRQDVNISGYYWSKSLNENATSNAYAQYFNSKSINNIGRSSKDRNLGLPIRAVLKK